MATRTDAIQGESFDEVFRRFAVALTVRADLQSMKPGERRDFILDRLADLLDLHLAELQRRADLAERLRDRAHEG